MMRLLRLSIRVVSCNAIFGGSVTERKLVEAVSRA